MSAEPGTASDIRGASALAILGDSITTDHISPAGAIKRDGPAGHYLMERQIRPNDFNSFGARRGNHEIMMRGTFANIRIKNLMLGGSVEGGYTKHVPSGEKMDIYDAAMKYKDAGTPRRYRRKGIWHRLVARLGSKRHRPARRQGRDCREL